MGEYRVKKSLEDVLGRPRCNSEGYQQIVSVLRKINKDKFTVSMRKFKVVTNIKFGGFIF